MPNILVINGHPNPESFTSQLAALYADAAQQAGATVQRINLHALDFDPILHLGYRGTQELEPDLKETQKALDESDHLVILAPLWWGSTPALLKGFFDRTLEAKWAYHYDDHGLPHGHFGGRSARFVMTADSPGRYLTLLQGRPTVKQVAQSTLRFCGFKPVSVTRYSPVRTSSAAKRQQWLDDVQEVAKSDVEKLHTRNAKAGKKNKTKQNPFLIREELLGR